MRALGRVGQPLSGGTYRPRRRLRVPRVVVVAVATALVAAVWVAFVANQQVAPTADAAAPVTAATVPERPAADQASRSRTPAAQATLMATADGLELAVPHRNPILVAFHEASRVDAMELAPVGTLIANDNPTRFSPPPDADGAPYRVLSSRGRARPATSAADIVVPLGDSVVAPVTGTVAAVTEYPLYGRIRDWRVEIVPQGRPDLTVVLIHLLRPAVEVGDLVTMGDTAIGAARLLPMDSHVDYVTDEKQPHVHMEVKPSVAAEPIDPNAPALPVDPTSAPDL